MVNTMIAAPPPPPSVEEGIDAFLATTQQTIHRHIDQCEDDIRHSPAKAVLVAATVGYCLHRLPVRAIVAAHVRLAAALVPPALFLFGAAKVYDLLQRQVPVAPLKK